jgi:hypothetical protein
MRLLNRTGIVSLISTLLALILLSPSVAFAATNPNLGTASSLTILSGTYSNTVSGTTLNGDLGYTTGPAVTPTVNGHTYVADGTYNQAGIDQGTALSALNVQPCTVTFPQGAIDLATDTTHGTVGVYAPGVYCISGAATIGGGGTITLSGNGTYIFRMTGALNTSANSIITLSNGATACDVWWTPGAATTLGANSKFQGTDIDASGTTIGSTITWTGRALSFGGTVSTTTDTINIVPTCAVASTTPSTSSTTTKKAGLPNTGLAPIAKNNQLWSLPIILFVIISAVYLIRRENSNKA